MTDNTEPVVGAGGQPTPTASNVGASPVDGSALEAALARINKLEADLRGLQSEKDKGVAKVGKRVSDLEEQINRYEELKAEGLSPKRALREMQLDTLVQGQAVASPADVAPAAGAGTQGGATGVDYAAYAKSFGLDANDPDVLRATLAESNPLKALDNLRALSEARKNPASPPPASAPLPSGGGVSVREETLEDVTAQLDEAMSQPKVDMAKVKALRSKQAALLPRG